MEIYFIGIYIVSLTVFILFIHHQTKKFANLVKCLQITDERTSTSFKEQLTSYELERLEREDEFDERIAKLKEELANQQHILHIATTAEEFHPLVKNLPHDIIKTKYDTLPDVEYVE